MLKTNLLLIFFIIECIEIIQKLGSFIIPSVIVCLMSIREHRTRHTWRDNKILYYKLSPKLLGSQVKDAILHIFIQDTSTEPLNVTLSEDLDRILGVTLQVSRITRNDQQNTVLKTVVATSSSGLSRRDVMVGRWVKVNVTQSVSDWFELPRTTLGYVVKAQDSEKRWIQVPDANAEHTNVFPYLEVYLEESPHKRSKRRTEGLTCSEDSAQTRCCKHPLTVDFEAFGWDWVIAPKKFEANFCMGDCPFAFLQKHPSTHVVQLASPQGYPGPCCTPRKMSSISMLHFDHEFNIILDNLPAMVTEHCGCS